MGEKKTFAHSVIFMGRGDYSLFRTYVLSMVSHLLFLLFVAEIDFKKQWCPFTGPSYTTPTSKIVPLCWEYKRFCVKTILDLAAVCLQTPGIGHGVEERCSRFGSYI